MTTELIVRAIFDSYAYNREFSYMVELCQEVIERVHGLKSSNRTHDGDIIYGFLVLMFGDYGTSPRSGWIEDHINDISSYIMELMDKYKELEQEENEDG